MTDTIWLTTLLLLIVWRSLHREATAPGDPVLWVVGQVLAVWRGVRGV